MSLDTTGEYISEFTRNTLAQFDWQPGDPIPAGLSALFGQIRERTGPPLGVGLIIDIAAMTADEIAAVKLQLAAEKITVARANIAAEKESKIGQLTLEERAFYDKIAPADNEPYITDDRDSAAAEPQAPDVAESAEPAEATAAVSDGRVAHLNTTVLPVICPRCTFDTRLPFNCEVTDEDKELFMLVLLGDHIFEKGYVLLAGKYAIFFRGLNAEDGKAIHRQLTIDQKRGEFNSDTEWFLRFFEYRLACSISRIIIADKLKAEIPTLAETKFLELPLHNDDLSRSALLRLHDYVIKDLLKSELVRRLVGAKFREFQRLCETLEAMALEPSFWEGVGSAH